MPFNPTVDAEISRIVSDWGTTRRKMFGGTCHLMNGNMMCGVYKDDLILRLGEDQASEALKQEHVRPFDMTGRPMKGWVMVEGPGFDGPMLIDWLTKAKKFVDSLAPK